MASLCMQVGLLSRHIVGLLFVGLYLTHRAHCAHILMAPFMWRSHINQHIIIGNELVQRGHSVSLLMSESFSNREDIPSTFQVVTFATKYQDFYTISTEESDDIMETAMRITPLQDLRWHAESFEPLCKNALEDEHLFRRLSESKIDLAIVDAFCYSRCYYILMHNLNIPYVSSTTLYEPWISRNLANPSYVPFQLAAGPFTTRMSLMEKIQNLIIGLDWAAFPRIRMLEDSFAQQYIRPELNSPPMTYSQLSTNSLLWLIDADWTMDYPRATMPNEINIGGLSTRPAKNLTGNFRNFADNASQGLILVTFGTHDILTPQYANRFLDAFRRLPQYRALIRYARDMPKEFAASLPANVMISKWVPQNDILGHPNTQLFITHGGANGQHEALYHAVPLITMPLMGDQPYNALRAEYFGCGLKLDLITFSADDLVEAIREVMGNKTYKENMVWRSAAFRGARDTPRERAAWWIEYVIKNGGRHLRAHALDMPWYEYLMLDLLLILVVLPVMLVMFFCISTIFFFYYSTSRTDKKHETSTRKVELASASSYQERTRTLNNLKKHD